MKKVSTYNEDIKKVQRTANAGSGIYEAIQPELEVIRKRNDTRREDIKNELQF